MDMSNNLKKVTPPIAPIQNHRENAALFTGMCFFTGLNYLGQRLVVFKNSAEEENH